MHATFTLSALALLGVFAAGCALGWITSLILPGLIPAGIGLSSQRAVSSRTQVYQVNCRCGEVLKFRGPDDTGMSGLPPLPADDSYSCPKCGTSIDLRRVREAIASVSQSRR